MKRRIKGLVGFLSLCLAFYMGSIDCRAAQTGAPAAPYTYTVTIRLGNPNNGGSFTGTPEIYGNDGVSVNRSGDAIVISGLNAGTRINLTAQDFVSVAESGKYYAKAIRQSGRDDTLSAYVVKGDMDFVVAYGIKGEMVAYTVNYQDAAGNSLLESRTYYGNVGERPVVAFRYIEGYEPQAYNLTGTLSASASENVFTFVYTPVETETAAGTQTVTQIQGTTTTVQGGTVTQAPGGAAQGGAEQGGAEQGGAIQGAPAPAGPAAPDDDQGDDGQGDQTDVPDDQVPLNEGPPELATVDDEEVPLADLPKGLDLVIGKRMSAVAIAIDVISAATLIGILFWLRRQRKKKKEEM